MLQKTGASRGVVCSDHGRISISGLRHSVAIRTNVRIDCFIQVILVRPKRCRLAKATVRALVFPGIDNQIVFVEMVIRTREIGSTALGAITNLLTFTGHLFGGKKESFRPFLMAASLERGRRTSRCPITTTPVARWAHPVSGTTTGIASRSCTGSVGESTAVPTGWFFGSIVGSTKLENQVHLAAVLCFVMKPVDDAV